MTVRALQLLNAWLGKDVLVELKWGERFKGRLTSFDSYMNMVLDNTKEIREDGEKELSRIVIRGNNIVFISRLPEGESQ